MTVTQKELDEFATFARERLSNGGARSLSELVAQWETHCECEATAADIRQGLADIDAGKGKPVQEAFAEVRRKLVE